MNFKIQYDPAKNIANLRKHGGVSLADADAVLFDEAALTLQDRDHDEARWVTLGKDASGRLLVVAYTYREPDIVRIISARLATRHERRQYQEA